MRSTFAVAAATLAGGVSATFSATSKTNVVTYWGQGAGQDTLLSYCENPNIDIINIGFVNVFPDQGKAGWPGTNFGNACGSEVYTHNNMSTDLLSYCPQIGPDIVLCQSVYGKKIFLSIGGAGADTYNDNSTSGQNFAKFLWGAFGPNTTAWAEADGPRPFGDAVVDGFGFDIESELSSAPVLDGTTITNYMTLGWTAMVNEFKNTLFPEDASKSYYLSAAPQCVVPDAHLSNAIANAWFDFIFVQFYNTASCSARSALSSSTKRATGFTGYDNWVSATSLNPDAMIYMGLAASTASASEATYYLEPSEVQTLVNEIYSSDRFGGIMLWEASTGAGNIICDRDYPTWMKQILDAKADGQTLNTEQDPCRAQTVSTDGSCGTYNGLTCAGSMFGQCCSIYGYCGDTSEYCATASCDPNGGDCGDEYVGIISNAISTSNSSSSVSGTSTSVSSIILTTAAGTAVSAGVVATASTSGLYGNPTYSQTADAVLADPTVLSTSTVSTITGLDANSSYAETAGASLADPTALTTSTIFSTATMTITTTDAAGEPTVHVTEDVTSYTTICPVTAAEAIATAGAVLAGSTVLTTSTIYSTATATITTTNAAGEATVYVTEDVTSYTTICPVTAAEATETASTSSSSVVVASTTPASGSSYGAAAVNVNYAPSTRTLYTTQHVTVTGNKVVVTLTSSYAVGTSVVSSVSESAPSTSASVVVVSPSAVSEPSSYVAGAIDVAPYALSNSSVIYAPTAGTAVSVSTSPSVIVQIVTATIAPVQAEATAAAKIANGTIGVASASLAYNVSASSTYLSAPMYTGAATRVEYGVGAIALAVGAIFAL
ncbi:glycoside hydrolase superfamily [Delphinella strobiligena]|nr:glycoside hydrolase superfamily [Delphinella strobiligena]